MRDSEYNIQKKRLMALTKKWITPLSLRWWKVKIVYSRESLTSENQKAAGRYCQARTIVDWEYLMATITFDMQGIAELNDSDLEEVYIHECCHILVHEMRQWASNEITVEKKDEGILHEERVVTQLAKAFLWTREAGENTFNKLHPKPKIRKILYPLIKISKAKKDRIRKAVAKVTSKKK